MLREHPTKKGKPQIVLVDHGLYKALDKDFQDAYARLWKGIVVADIEEIKCACESLGVTKMVSEGSGVISFIYDILHFIQLCSLCTLHFFKHISQYPLLAAMLTSRPFDEVIERSHTRTFDVASKTSGSDQMGGDKAVIRGYAQRYLKGMMFIVLQIYL